jgi:hypothetical protein
MNLTDRQAKRILSRWPSRTKRLWRVAGGKGYWTRATPKTGSVAVPRLKSPGAALFTTQPDGMWVYVQGMEFADAIVVEVCGSIQNLNDKRSRYIPASHSLVLACPLQWLLEPTTIQRGGRAPRWRAMRTLHKPRVDLIAPIRHLRVLYALPSSLYDRWVPNHVPTGYEFFCTHKSLSGYNSQKMQMFLRQMSMTSSFLTRA